MAPRKKSAARQAARSIRCGGVAIGAGRKKRISKQGGHACRL